MHDHTISYMRAQMQELDSSRALARVSRKLKKNSLPKSFGFLRNLKVFEPSGIPLVLYYRLVDHIRTLLIFLNSHSDSCISVQTESVRLHFWRSRNWSDCFWPSDEKRVRFGCSSFCYCRTLPNSVEYP